MKKMLFLAALLLLSVTVNAQLVSIVDASGAGRGDSVDRVRYEVVYNLDATVPAKRDTTHYQERMILQIGSMKSAFFSYVAYQVDSLVREQIAHGEPVNVQSSSQVSWKLYKQLPAAGQTIYLDRVCNDNFRVVEKMENPSWKLIADSAKTILGYPCRLAETRFKGRLWRAWYAPDVPIDNGPWKLQGLPGLILMAADDHQEFVFMAVGLTNVNGARNIYYRGKNYQDVSRKALNSVYKHYYADAIGYARMTYPQSSTSSIRITNGDGKELFHSKPVPYNLIEW